LFVTADGLSITSLILAFSNIWLRDLLNFKKKGRKQLRRNWLSEKENLREKQPRGKEKEEVCELFLS
jgi:hypothetical protein